MQQVMNQMLMVILTGLIKYNSSGVFQWKVNKNGTDNGDDFAYDIAFDKLQKSYRCGQYKKRKQQLRFNVY